MTCKYCHKELIDSKNSNCKVSHLRSCRPEQAAKLANKINNLPVLSPISIKFTDSQIKVIIFKVFENSWYSWFIFIIFLSNF